MTQPTHNPYSAEAQRERHRKLVATWAAAGGTLAVIVALWAMLLPVTLGSQKAFGALHLPRWAQPDDQAAAPGFDEAMARMRATLDRAEGQARQEAGEEQAAAQADRLRTRIESEASAKNTAEPQQP